MAGLDFLIIGAPRCGTTTLHEHLRRHPEVFMPGGKEVPFFSDPQRFQEGWEAFSNLYFPEAKVAGRICGKASPQYMAGSLYGSGTQLSAEEEREPELIIPRRIVGLSPRVKLIAVLRDPVARAISQHNLAAMVGWDKRPLGVSLLEDLEPERLWKARLHPNEANSQIVIGEYERVLAGYLQFFERDRLLVVSFQDFKEHEAAVLTRIYRFLDIDSDFVPDSIGQAFNPSADRQRIKALDPSRLKSTAQRSASIRRVWRRLPRSTQLRILRAHRDVSYKLFLWNRESSDRSRPQAEASPEVISMVTQHFASYNARLADLVGDVPGVTDGR